MWFGGRVPLLDPSQFSVMVSGYTLGFWGLWASIPRYRYELISWFVAPAKGPLGVQSLDLHDLFVANDVPVKLDLFILEESWLPHP